jgi:uncharacterized repeat protein (TIGR03803 family)
MEFGLQSGKLGLAALFLIAGAVAANPVSARSYKYRVLYSFCKQANCADGEEPVATLLMDQAGNLYGTTGAGGAQNDGTVFELTPGDTQKWKHKVLYSFCSQANCPNGGYSSLIVDTSGNLYGTTGQSTDSDGGVVFELKPKQGGGWSYRLLYTFPCSSGECPNGSIPSGLTYLGAAAGQPYDGTSPLFGSTEVGGTGATAHFGVAFKLEPRNRGWKQTVLYNFCSLPNCTDGGTPYGPPVMDSAGRLFGTTAQGGGGDNGGDENFAGTVYSITGTNESVIYDFCSLSNCADGGSPQSPVFLDNFGRLVGTTTFGGAHGPASSGTLFAVSGASVQVLDSFSDGARPSAGVIEDSAGHIFGVIPAGGDANGDGVVFEYRGGAQHVLHIFCSAAGCADGCTPMGGLIMDASGNIYGTTSQCGAGNGGTVFELSPI